jgi:hypothetical protein
MTMGISLSHPAPTTHEITPEDRMERLGELTPAQRGDELLWLSGYAPDVFDVVLDAIEPFPGDGTDDPAPYCDRCGADIGVFLRFGLEWRHYRSAEGEIELFDPGHPPHLAWLMTAVAAI